MAWAMRAGSAGAAWGVALGGVAARAAAGRRRAVRGVRVRWWCMGRCVVRGMACGLGRGVRCGGGGAGCRVGWKWIARGW